MAEQTRQPKRNRHTGAKVTAAAAVLLALLGGGRYGLGLGQGGGGLLSAEKPQPEPVPAAETVVEEKAEDDGVLSLVVRESAVLYEGRELTLAELEAALLSDYTDGTPVELRDDHAIKAAYDEVEALLQKLDIPYTVAAD